MLAWGYLSPWRSHIYLDPASMFLATLSLFLFLVLAYFTNPSESSFRSYLTEQSFRHHLSRLDDPQDRDSRDSDNPSPTSLESGSHSVHFSSRAAVSLRTPKHDFRSFAFFTIAAVLPSPANAKQQPSSTAPAHPAWFIGAFGKWWRGGPVDATWPTPQPRSAKSEEDAWSSGIMTVKALDRGDKHDGLPLPTTSSARNSSTPRTPPKLRARERPAPRISRPRSGTPPPLPKSATLPLHTPRHSQSTLSASQAHHTPQQQQQPQHHQQLPPPTSHPPPPAHPPPQSFDSAPAVVDLLRQIAHAKSTNADLRAQLSDHAATSQAAESALHAELASVRDAKRTEDAARADLKTRTKTLEEAKRAAEASKRDAERRLGAAQKARDDADERARVLGAEIAQFNERARADGMRAREVAAEAEAEECELAKALERTQEEVNQTDMAVGELAARAKGLEEDISAEERALSAVRDHAEMLRQDRSFLSLTVIRPTDDVFPTPLEKDSDARSRSSGSGSIAGSNSNSISNSGSGSSDSREVSSSPRPRPLNLRSISNHTSNTAPGAGRAPGYVPFNADPLDTLDAAAAVPLIPHALIRSLERPSAPVLDGLPASFQSDGDAILERDWRARAPSDGPRAPGSGAAMASASHSSLVSSRSSASSGFPLSASPVSIKASPPFGTDDDAHDPFTVRAPPVQAPMAHDPFKVRAPARFVSDPFDGRPAPVWPEPLHQDRQQQQHQHQAPEATRRRWWESTSSTSGGTKGLNPDAKVFRFGRKSLPTPVAGTDAVFDMDPPSLGAGFDSLNPSALPVQAPGGGSGGLLASLAARAFAPSPAEREALQRVLGSSTNTSLERLPSLAEVNVNVPGTVAATAGVGVGSGSFERPAGGFEIAGPAAKITFSPWAEGDV